MKAPKSLTWEQQRRVVDLMLEDGYPFDVAVAKFLGIRINWSGDKKLFRLGELAVEEAVRRGYLKRAEPEGGGRG